MPGCARKRSRLKRLRSRDDRSSLRSTCEGRVAAVSPIFPGNDYGRGPEDDSSSLN
jgi:hypothetical protein